MEARALGVVNQGLWCQASFETGVRGLRKLVNRLRKEGYQVSSCPMGHQVTRWGVVKLTILDIRPGRNTDTSNINIPS